MSILLDRLCGYDLDEPSGKTKLAIHAYVDVLAANVKGWNGAPTPAEINQAFGLAGQPFDPTNTQVDDTNALIALVTAGTRTRDDVQAALRLGEQFPNVITKLRVAQMLTLA